MNRSLPVVLLAEEGLGDRLLLQEAFQATDTKVDFRPVASGEEFLDYLYRRPPWNLAERPDLVLLDLNMPGLNGLETLGKIKANPELKSIPIVVLATFRHCEEIAEAYNNGANSVLLKPGSFDELVNAARSLCEFWFKLCVLPGSALGVDAGRHEGLRR